MFIEAALYMHSLQNNFLAVLRSSNYASSAYFEKHEPLSLHI